MAAGEYVSVSSQRDSEAADLRLEAKELRADPEGELRELTVIYERRGLAPELAREVALTLSSHGALEAHARDELGLDAQRRARPLQAAWASAVSFSVGAILPLVAIGLSPESARVIICVAVTLVGLALLGYAGARLGGARPLRARLPPRRRIRRAGSTRPREPRPRRAPEAPTRRRTRRRPAGPGQPTSDVEAAGLTEVEQHRPGVVQQLEDPQRAVGGHEVEIGHAASEQRVPLAEVVVDVQPGDRSRRAVRCAARPCSASSDTTSTRAWCARRGAGARSAPSCAAARGQRPGGARPGRCRGGSPGRSR
jgi:hypothetical protein